MRFKIFPGAEAEQAALSTVTLPDLGDIDCDDLDALRKCFKSDLYQGFEFSGPESDEACEIPLSLWRRAAKEDGCVADFVTNDLLGYEPSLLLEQWAFGDDLPKELLMWHTTISVEEKTLRYIAEDDYHVLSMDGVDFYFDRMGASISGPPMRRQRRLTFRYVAHRFEAWRDHADFLLAKAREKLFSRLRKPKPQKMGDSIEA